MLGSYDNRNSDHSNQTAFRRINTGRGQGIQECIAFCNDNRHCENVAFRFIEQSPEEVECYVPTSEENGETLGHDVTMFVKLNTEGNKQ